MTTRRKPTYPLVKEKLITAFREGHIGGDNVKVFDCFPNFDDMKNECVVVANTDDADTDWGPFGDNLHAEDEKYSIMIDFVVYKEVLEPIKIRERCFDIYNDAQALLREDPKLGIGADKAGSMIVQLVIRAVNENPWDEGRVCAIRASLRVKARI